MKTQKLAMSMFLGIGMIANSGKLFAQNIGENAKKTNSICQCVERGGGTNCGSIPATATTGAPAQGPGHTGTPAQPGQ
jgi:hypothetical protein